MVRSVVKKCNSVSVQQARQRDMADRAPRVSVIIPYYNSAWSIERTLRSIFAQNFQGMEVILVDDGSPDDVLPLTAPFGHRVRIVRQENRGLAGARNRGISESTGTYVAPIDADDLWHPDYLGAMVQALDAAPHAPFAFSDSYRIDEMDMMIPFREPVSAPRVDFEGLISLNSVGSGSAAVFRRSALLAKAGYDESLKTRAAQGAEDWKLLVQLAAIAPPVHVRRKLVAYRLTAGGMSQARPARQLAAAEAVIGDLTRDYPEVGTQLFRDARTMMIAWLLPAFLRRHDYGAAFREGVRAYVLNPFWWRNRNLRLAHMAWLRMLLRSLFQRGRSARLAELEEAGERPFAFLENAK